MVEDARVDALASRGIIMKIEEIKILATKSKHNFDKRIATMHLFGLFNMKLATIWKKIQESLVSLARQDYKLFWPILHDLWLSTQQNAGKKYTRCL